MPRVSQAEAFDSYVTDPLRSPLAASDDERQSCSPTAEVTGLHNRLPDVSNRGSTSLAAALGGSAVAAAVVAFLRYRATGISGAVFERSVGGTHTVVTYENPGPWFWHYMTWRGTAIGLAMASLAVLVTTRRA